VKKYQELAKQCNISIVPGTIVERHIVEKSEEDPEDKGHKLLNVAYFIDNNGEIVGKYIKKNLWYVSLYHKEEISEREKS
jgi:predicted amidohydrolase